MPKRNDIHKILIIGSGPIIIGQACEFDYSGTQACKALRNLGYEIVLVNSNPATIMTDPSTADVTYIEPLNVERLTEIIAKERPDALLPNLGGQSGLNLCEELYHAGVLDKYNVEVIGVQVDAISRGEDRIEFKNAMDKLGIEMAKSAPAYSVEEALKIAEELGYPCVIRPAYTMGGTGGGIVYNEEELKKVAARGIAASMVNQILVEESVIGWEELEVEVVRDKTGKKISICFIENIEFIGRAYRVKNYKEIADKYLEAFKMTENRKKLAKELSKGMRQKLSMILAFMIEPKALLVDEPMVGLDPASIEEVLELFRQLRAEGTAILISTHIIDIVNDIWDRAYIMNRGEIVKEIDRKDAGEETLKEIFFETTREGDV